MLALILTFIFTYFENVIFKKNNKLHDKFFFYFVFIFFTSVLFLFAGAALETIGFLDLKFDFSFLEDYRFWIFVLLEVLGMFSLNLNYIYNKNNHTIVNMGIYTTLVFTPVMVFFLDPILGFEETRKVTMFSDFGHILAYTFLVSLLIVLYFFDKIKSATLNNPPLVVLTVVSLLLSFYMEVKIIQTYTFNLYIYAFQDFLLSIVYLLASLWKGEKREAKTPFKALSCSVKFFPLHIMSAVALTIVAVEVGLLFRRGSQITAGLIIDKKKHPPKDYLIMVLFILIGIFLIYQ